MKIKRIEHERGQDAPFVGALICANDCHKRCKGCINKDIKKEPSFEASAEEILEEVMSNPFNKGIILGGLEWAEQPQDLLDICYLASKKGLEIMIYTGNDINVFRAIIGKSCADKVGFDDTVTEKMLAENDSTFHALVGAMILDYYIPTTYYVKCGSYDKDKVVDDYVEFGVKLATSNQKIYKFEPSDYDGEDEIDIP